MKKCTFCGLNWLQKTGEKRHTLLASLDKGFGGGMTGLGFFELPIAKAVLAAVLIAVAIAIYALASGPTRQATATNSGSSGDHVIKSLNTTETSTSSIPPDSSTSAEESFNSEPGTSSTSVIVNGQSVPVPQNGSVTKTIENNGGNTSVNVQSQTTTQGSANNNSSTSLDVRVFSSSSTTSEEDSL